MAAEFTASREAGLQRLAEFVPRAGTAYSKNRNFDFGPGDRSNVSMLSPYLRHRLIGEDEVVRAVLRKHRISAADKFVQEVCWRTYWKGWLEQRPSVWFDYAAERDRERSDWAADPAAAERLRQAETGETGLECLDAWAKELVETGYLHNHTRMWFASIWIFTLNLPWTLGADFFYRNLIDGDPASNTLSWRWVAGLQTQGRHYLARASNISDFTNGRFNPVGDLNESADAIAGPSHPEPKRLRPVMSVAPAQSVVLLVFEDDLSPEHWPVPREAVCGVAAMPADRRTAGLSETVLAFRTAALADALTRAGQEFSCPVLQLGPNSAAELAAFCQSSSADVVATTCVPVGPSVETLQVLFAQLQGTGLGVLELRRAWDAAFWPFARRGFFQLKERIPETLERLGML